MPILLAALFACSNADDGLGAAQLRPADDTTAPPATAPVAVPPTGSTAPVVCDEPEPLPEGAPLRDGMWASHDVEPCGERLHALIGAEGTRMELTLTGWSADAPAYLELRDWLGTPIRRVEGLVEGDTVELELPWSGEHPLIVGSDDGSPSRYTVDARCLEGCDRVATRYPIVLMHGMAGTDAFFDVLEYYLDVTPALEAAGHQVLVEAVDPFQPTTVRAAAWEVHLTQFFALGTARRVNLVGHSQGGLDARYVASLLDPDQRVRSITTVATPHRGAVIADLGYGLLGGVDVVEDILDFAFDELAALYGITDDQDFVAQVDNLTSATAAAFNADVRDREDVAYYSWAGASCQLLDLLCQADHGGEVVTPLLSFTHLVTLLIEGDNDGLVSVESSKWGTFRGTVDADHLDEVGLLFGTDAQTFDHQQFFVEQAAFLVDEGF